MKYIVCKNEIFIKGMYTTFRNIALRLHTSTVYCCYTQQGQYQINMTPTPLRKYIDINIPGLLIPLIFQRLLKTIVASC